MIEIDFDPNQEELYEAVARWLKLHAEKDSQHAPESIREDLVTNVTGAADKLIAAAKVLKDWTYNEQVVAHQQPIEEGC